MMMMMMLESKLGRQAIFKNTEKCSNLAGIRREEENRKRIPFFHSTLGSFPFLYVDFSGVSRIVLLAFFAISEQASVGRYIEGSDL